MARHLGLKFYRACVKEGLNVTEGECGLPVLLGTVLPSCQLHLAPVHTILLHTARKQVPLSSHSAQCQHSVQIPD